MEKPAIADHGRPVSGGRAGYAPTAASAQAVYRCFSADGQLLYVGTSGRLGRRLAEHAQKLWFLEVYGITFEWHPDETSALAAERRCIKMERPKYNIVYRDSGPDLKPQRRASSVVTSITPPRPLGRPERRADLMRALAEASEGGVSPRDLVSASGLSPSLVHDILSRMLQRDEVVRVSHGHYRMRT